MRNDILYKIDLDPLKKADKIIIGLSGGADSVALTHILYRAVGSEKLIAAHVNHNLRGAESLRDEMFVKEYCRRLGIELHVKSINIKQMAESSGLGEEECGRRERYGFFETLADGSNDIIVTAHNADDNAETVIMNLANGCALNGLCGIPVRRGKIYRPLLKITRNEIEEYDADQKLEFVTDSTNLTDVYKRNIIRHRVIPAVMEINGSAVENISRMTDLVSDDRNYLEKKASELLENAATDRGLLICELRKGEIPILSRALMKYLQPISCGRLEEKHIYAVMEALCKESSMLDLPGRITVTIGSGLLTAAGHINELNDTEIHEGENFLSDGRTIKIIRFSHKKGEKINKLLFNNCIDYDTITNIIIAGPRREGDRFSPAGRNLTKSVKDLFIEMKVPRAYRNDVAVLRHNDDIIYIEGIGPSDKYRVRSESENCLRIEISKEIV
jgi:tRNA(Ile)-lysidine synthase